MQAEVVLELRRHLGKHPDVRAGGEKLVSRAADHNDVHGVVHPRVEDVPVQLLEHLVRVGIRGRIVQLEDRDTFFHAVIDEGF